MKNKNIDWSENLFTGILIMLFTFLFFLLFAGTAKSQEVAIYDFHGFGTDTNFITTKGHPHIGDDDHDFWYSFQHIQGYEIDIHTVCPMPKMHGVYMFSLRCINSHPVDIYTINTAGTKVHVGQIPVSTGMPETYVFYFLTKKLVSLQFTTGYTSEYKVFQFDEFFLNYLGSTPSLKVISRQGLTGWKEQPK